MGHMGNKENVLSQGVVIRFCVYRDGGIESEVYSISS